MTNTDEHERQRHAKFIPVSNPFPGWKLPVVTRLYFEYEAGGEFAEFNPATGEMLGKGVVERPEKDVAGTIADALRAA